VTERVSLVLARAALEQPPGGDRREARTMHHDPSLQHSEVRLDEQATETTGPAGRADRRTGQDADLPVGLAGDYFK
jgi:hypothetical protein